MSRILVTDASVVVDVLARFAPEPIEDELLRPDTKLVAPELLDIEVLHTFRRLESLRAIPPSRRGALLASFRALPIRRYRHSVLWDDIWKLRKNLTAYDACYVALARQLGAAVLTRDERLARAPDRGVEVIVV